MNRRREKLFLATFLSTIGLDPVLPPPNVPSVSSKSNFLPADLPNSDHLHTRK